jgi:hypothetical protein
MKKQKHSRSITVKSRKSKSRSQSWLDQVEIDSMQLLASSGCECTGYPTSCPSPWSDYPGGADSCACNGFWLYYDQFCNYYYYSCTCYESADIAWIDYELYMHNTCGIDITVPRPDHC